MKLTIRNVPVEISFTLVCIAAVCLVLNIFQGFLWCALAVVIHESGHLCAMLLCKSAPERVRISAFEIKLFDLKRALRDEKQNIFIIFFGPMFNFICFIPFYLLYLLGNDALLPFAVSNLSVGLFNSLPVMSLDGGQLIFILLRRRLGLGKAEKAVDIITFITIFPLAALGFAVLLSTKYNFSLLFVCAYLTAALVTRGGRYI